MQASKAIRISVTLILAATAPSAFAKDGRVLFDQKVLRSDLIAVAEITSVASQGTNFQRGREYRSLANLKIIEGIKAVRLETPFCWSMTTDWVAQTSYTRLVRDV
jgi:hypothetical protein